MRFPKSGLGTGIHFNGFGFANGFYFIYIFIFYFMFIGFKKSEINFRFWFRLRQELFFKNIYRLPDLDFGFLMNVDGIL